MYKLLILLIAFQLTSCTDQGESKQYAFKNTTNYNLEVILYERFGNNDSFSIKSAETKVLDQDEPPYDDGPFGVFDSLKLFFEDSKKLTYIPLRSKDDCSDSIKNPFCPYSNYNCVDDMCTFVVDIVEYQKAR